MKKINMNVRDKVRLKTINLYTTHIYIYLFNSDLLTLRVTCSKWLKRSGQGNIILYIANKSSYRV